MLHRLRHHLRAESGQAAIEYALVLPLVIVLLIFLVDFGFVFNYWNNEQELAGATARYAAVGRNPGPGATLQESMRSQIGSRYLRDGGSKRVPTGAQICVAFPQGRGVGKPVTVTVATDYHWIRFVPYVADHAAWHLQGSATMRQEGTPSTTDVPDGCG